MHEDYDNTQQYTTRTHTIRHRPTFTEHKFGNKENGIMRLYQVTSKTKVFLGYKDVKLHWFFDIFAGSRPDKRPYAELIKDYDPSDNVLAEHCIDELFTEDEARQLKEYIDLGHGHSTTTTIKEVELPIDKHASGISEQDFEYGDGFYELSRESDDPLPFKVSGFFDLWGCEFADGSGIFEG
jgi:hypothetical protein